MKIPNIYFNPIQIKGDPDATRQMANFLSKQVDILRDIYQHLKTVKIVTAAPTAAELQELLDSSDVVILHHATAGNRKVYYKYQGTVYAITSA